MKVMKRGQVLAAVTIYLPAEIHQKAINCGLNLSASGRDGITRALEDVEQDEKNTGNPELSTARGRRATN